jgi:hypothetical protein
MGKSTTKRRLLLIAAISGAVLFAAAAPASAGELSDQVRGGFAGDVIHGGSGPAPTSVSDQFAKDVISGGGEYPAIEPGSIVRQMQ